MEPRCEQVIKRIQHALLAQSYSAWENFVTERQLNQALAKKMVGRLMNRVCQLAFAQWVAVMERVRARRQDDVKNVDDEAW